MTPLLAVDGLAIEFASAGTWRRVVDDVSFELAAGETLGLVGESGCGKTVTALSILGLLPARVGRVATGAITFDGRDLTSLSAAELRRVRGAEIAMIFQEPMTSLNPAYTIGDQIGEAVRVHEGAGRADARRRAVELLERVGIPDAARRVRDYPHQFSGGMRQRVMIAMALACDPRVLIADEPTTALDVTVQAQILELLRELQQERRMAIMLVTHDLGVVAETCDRVVVMYAGQVVEEAPAAGLFSRPRHPYTEGLLGSLPQFGAPGAPLRVIPGQVPPPNGMPPGCRFAPRCAYAEPECNTAPVELVAHDTRQARCRRHRELELIGVAEHAAAVADRPTRHADEPSPIDTAREPVLEVRDLSKQFALTSGFLRRVTGLVQAVDAVTFAVDPGETLGLVGESGSGKSTTARLALRLIEPSSGSVRLGGDDLLALGGAQLRAARRRAQMVFQDPFSSLDPRRTVAESVGEPLEIHEGLRRRDRDERVAALLDEVGLARDALHRFPHEFSGGQRQRIAIARALAPRPELLVCDEPLSSLDVSTQSQVINLFVELRERLGIASLLISHDLSVVRHLAHRVAVMYLGRIVEIGRAEEVTLRPVHPYTHALLSSVPVPDPARAGRPRVVLTGEPPSPVDPPSGCRFHPRCPWVMDVCRRVDPPAYETAAGTTVNCHLHTEGLTLAGAPIASTAVMR
jgi:peptide/nickel transport system ATP-binding protein